LEELLVSNAERLHFSTDLNEAIEHAQLLFVAVGTPQTHAGDADLSAVRAKGLGDKQADSFPFAH
jgi:UDPglucose 6-dehydrogenase